MESIRYEEILYFVIMSMNWIFLRRRKTNDIGENVWLIRSMFIIQRLVYDDGKVVRVILMWINLGIMIGICRINKDSVKSCGCCIVILNYLGTSCESH